MKKMFLFDLLKAGFKYLGKLMERFFKSARGKRVKGWLPEAAAVIGMVAARTDNTVDDMVAKIAFEMGLGEKSPGDLLTGAMADWFKRETAKRLLQEQTKASDSEANLSIELALNQMKEGKAA